MKELVPPYVQKAIEAGEGLHQDFKTEIHAAKKLAPLICAFANCEGGRIWIGIKDSGSVSGCRPEEELYMVDAAAGMYCRPPVPFTHQVWNCSGKLVLEIQVEPIPEKGVQAMNEEGNYRAYIREGDETLQAPKVLFELWKFEKTSRPLEYTYTKMEQRIFALLNEHEEVSERMLEKRTRARRFVVIKTMAKLIRWGVVEYKVRQGKCYYYVPSIKNQP